MNSNTEGFSNTDENLKRIRDDVAKATVKLENGQGVLVPGNFIITAAHVVKFDCRGIMALDEPEYGEFHVERIRCSQYGYVEGVTVAVEPVSDIAVVGPMDGQERGEQCQAFERFCEKTKPVPLCCDELKPDQSFPIQVYTHLGKWITGSATAFCLNPKILVLKMHEPCGHGTSGGPVVNEAGKLVGVWSQSRGIGRGDEMRQTATQCPYLAMALPVWVRRAILGED